MNKYTARTMHSAAANDEERFVPHAMSKKELALMYLPDSTPHAAVGQLTRWIKMAKGLQEELEKTGYYKMQKMLTKRQVSIITAFIGEP